MSSIKRRLRRLEAELEVDVEKPLILGVIVTETTIGAYRVCADFQFDTIDLDNLPAGVTMRRSGRVVYLHERLTREERVAKYRAKEDGGTVNGYICPIAQASQSDSPQ
jgi:hypothetical protein